MSRAQAKAQGLARVDYPSNRLANIADLAVNEPLDVAYPDADSPGVLLKLGQAVEGASGPTATSSPSRCSARTRAGLLSYSARQDAQLPRPLFALRLRGGRPADLGPRHQNLPQFMLRVDGNGDIYAEGVDELIYGRLSNVL
jgi:arsenite oxidase small subunit